MAGIKVYGFPASHNTDRARLTLSIANVDYEFVRVNLAVGEEKSPEHRARSPWSKVPAISLADGATLCESRAIAKYVAARWAPHLLPPADDPLAIARFDEAASAEYGYFDKPVSQFGFEKYVKAFLGLPVDEKTVEDARKAIVTHLEVLDGILGGRKFVAGDTFGLADVFYLPHFRRLALAGEWDAVTARPNVEAWWKRCLENEPAKKYLGSMPTIEAMKKQKERMDAQQAAAKGTPYT